MLCTKNHLSQSLGTIPTRNYLTWVRVSRASRPMRTRHAVALPLTERQRQVAELQSAGLTYSAIGRQLGISKVRVREIAIRIRRVHQLRALAVSI